MSTAIKGVYLNPRGWLPISGVTITAYSTDGYSEGSATTDSNGQFSITGLTNRNWVAKATTAPPDFGVVLLLPNTVFHDNLSSVSADQHHVGFIALLDNAGATVVPNESDYIQVTDDGIINADKGQEEGGELKLSIDQSAMTHASIGELGADDHPQYMLTAGRSGGQTITGGVGSGEDLELLSTSHGTPGSIFLGGSSLFELTESSGQLKLATSGINAGLLLGGDALLYRVSADLLRTPDALTVDGALNATSGDVDGAVTNASTTAKGKIEIATAAETTTGTDATRAVSPDGLAGSIHGERELQPTLFDWATEVTVGDGAYYIHTGRVVAGMDLIYVHAKVITAGTTGTTDIQIRNVTQAADMLSTKLTIDSGETGSDTAATPAVINTDEDDVIENDQLRIDVDATSTTKAKGLIVTLGFRLP